MYIPIHVLIRNLLLLRLFALPASAGMLMRCTREAYLVAVSGFQLLDSEMQLCDTKTPSRKTARQNARRIDLARQF